jgi:hypothetical protein
MDLKKEVAEALDNAKENGFDFEDQSYEEIAADIVQHCSSLENVDPAELVQYIHEYFTN